MIQSTETLGSVTFILLLTGALSLMHKDTQPALPTRSVRPRLFLSLSFHDRRAALAVQETKAGVKRGEENEQPRPRSKSHV